jgi:hypothetical protein
MFNKGLPALRRPVTPPGVASLDAVPEPPTLSELQALAERALGHAEAEAEAQVTATWERDGDGDRLTVEVTCVIEGRAASRRADGPEDESLRRAAKAAALHATRARAWPAPELPSAAAGRPHEGFDPWILRTPPQPPTAAPAEGLDVTWRTGASRIAIASTRGVRATEQRSYAVAEVGASHDGRTIRLRAAAPSPRDVPLQALIDEARTLLLDDREPADLPGGDLHVVLGHDAVATLLDHLRPAFGVELDLDSGPLHGRFGTRVAAAAVNLSDSPRYRSTLPRTFDAEGVPRQPVPLIQDGVAHRRVHDTASAARAAGATSTGHASRAAALAPVPQHLVLVGGGASGIGELCAPIRRGVYVPALSPGREADGDRFLHTAHSAVLIEDGALAAPVRDGELLVEPLAVLASVEALSARSRTLPLQAHAPGGPGAAVVPALRAAAGCRAA